MGAALDKTAYYAKKSVAQDYDYLRYQRGLGPWVNQQECGIMLDLLRRNLALSRCRVLDVPVGTARLYPFLRPELPREYVGLDASESMIERARAKYPELVFRRADFFSLDEATKYDVIVSARFSFHFQDLTAILASAHRNLAPGGHFAFDALNWSPRQYSRLLNRNLGGDLFIHRRRAVEAAARKTGFEVIGARSLFALPSYAYPYLPSFLSPVVRLLEALWPAALKSKTIYLLRRTT
jgi:SAM-dependent methyltransferase